MDIKGSSSSASNFLALCKYVFIGSLDFIGMLRVLDIKRKIESELDESEIQNLHRRKCGNTKAKKSGILAPLEMSQKNVRNAEWFPRKNQ